VDWARKTGRTRFAEVMDGLRLKVSEKETPI
jgi:hypothetical protein